MAGMPNRFRVQDFVIRFVAIYALLLATYNPSGYSYVHWLFDAEAPYFPVKVFVGVTLFFVYGYIYAMAYRALLKHGFFLAGLFFASLAAALHSQGLLPTTFSAIVLLIQAGLAASLAAGMSFVLLWHHVSGQVTATPEVH